MISKRAGTSLLIAAALIVILALLLAPRLPQPDSYHHFADQRAWLGVPRFGDVTSNLPFAVIGLWGLAFLAGPGPDRAFTDRRERCPYFLAFFGLLLTSLGSAYYHLAPDNARLVWDRLPMTVVFMALVAAMIAERVSVELGLWLLPLLLALGVASVLQWYWSELRGVGDLRFYAAVQVFSMVVLLVALLLPPRYTRSADLAVVASLSGHTLKHLAAAAAGYWILRMLQRRKPIPCPVPAHS
jgi:hypothetical protein